MSDGLSFFHSKVFSKFFFCRLKAEGVSRRIPIINFQILLLVRSSHLGIMLKILCQDIGSGNVGLSPSKISNLGRIDAMGGAEGDCDRLLLTERGAGFSKVRIGWPCAFLAFRADAP